MLGRILTAILLTTATIAAPAPTVPILEKRDSKHFQLKPLFGGQSVSNGSHIQPSQAAGLSTFQLTGASPSWGEKFSTIVVGTHDGTDTLIAGYGGQSAIGLLGYYILGLPTVTYASLSIPDFVWKGQGLDLCIYIYSDPSNLKQENPSRDNFDLNGFVSELGLQGPVAEFCVVIGNPGNPSSPSSSSSSSIAPSKTSSMASSSPSASTSMTSSMVSSSTSSSSTISASSSSSPSSGSISRTRTEPNPAYATSASFNGQTYTNKGLVAFGAISGDAQDSTGLTLAGLGSGLAMKSFNKNDDGTFGGEIYCLPDRGHNTQQTVDYQARVQLVSFKLDPYYDEKKLGYDQAKQTLEQTYQETTLFSSLGQATTGADPQTYTNDTQGIHYPIKSATERKVSTDSEAIVYMPDGSFWISEEYGPYVYHFGARGDLMETIVPPVAALPEINGSLFFSANSDTDPTTGRIPNKGFEGLCLSPDGNTLYALLQEGTEQDSEGGNDKYAQYTRLFGWNAHGQHELQSSYVLELPTTNGKGKTLKQSDLACLSNNVFMVLSRDGHGNGDDESESKHKDFILYSTDGATNIANTDYTTTVKPVAPNNVLVDGVTQMKGTEFVDMIDETQLERFGLHNSGDFTQSLINSKWESSSIVSCQDEQNPDDYFLFSASDNDFISLHGVDPSGPYVDPYAQEKGYSLDNQVLVWRVTIPGYGK